jgi:hypothetical protein
MIFKKLWQIETIFHRCFMFRTTNQYPKILGLVHLKMLTGGNHRFSIVIGHVHIFHLGPPSPAARLAPGAVPVWETVPATNWGVIHGMTWGYHKDIICQY